MSIFPIIQPPTGAREGAQALPLCREAAWDYENDRPVFRQGKPVEATGKAAVQVWIWKALHTDRFRYEIYTWAYGSEFGALTGQTYTDTLKEAEAPRYLRECLLVNPYITAVKNISVAFENSRLYVSGTAETIYGEAAIDAII